MQFTGRDRNIIDIDLGAKAVFVGNETIAEFLDNGRQLKGKLNRDKHEFTINHEALRASSQKVGYPVDPSKVAEEYKIAMAK